MLKRIRSRIGQGLAALVAPYLDRSPETGSERIVLAPVMTAPCMAHHYLLESVLRLLARSDVATPALLKELAQEVTERCQYELYGKDAQVAVGIVEALIDEVQRSARHAAPCESESTLVHREVRASTGKERDGWGYPTSRG